MSLILASASPRRREILAGLGVEFDLVVPNVTEIAVGEPEQMVLENARRKATAGARLAGTGSVVMGVDTDVFIDGAALGKPGDRGEARERLERLAGRTHEVISAVVLLGPLDDGSEPAPLRSGTATTRVTFGAPSEEMLESYLDSGEWRDRAGAYAIQGLGSILVARVEGDVSNVIGLPVGVLLELAPELVASRS